jgi:hypothetical protein
MKKVLLPMIVFAVGISLSAFKQASRVLTSQGWFIYNGIGDPSDPSSYTYSSSDPGCSSSTALCAVNADIDPATMGGAPQDQKPLASGGTESLDVLKSQSQNFTQPTSAVEFHN